MKLKVKSLSTIGLISLLLGCGHSKISEEEAIKYQSKQLIETVKILYQQRAEIPKGDLTKIIVSAGGATENVPDVLDLDSPSNAYDRDAMRRLRLNEKEGTLHNEFGGQVRVTNQDGNIIVIYTNVHKDVNCALIENVICLREV